MRLLQTYSTSCLDDVINIVFFVEGIVELRMRKKISGSLIKESQYWPEILYVFAVVLQKQLANAMFSL